MSNTAGLELFKALIKDGCKWHGDILSKKWAECLFIEDESIVGNVESTLSMYTEGVDYKRDDLAIWIV